MMKNPSIPKGRYMLEPTVRQMILCEDARLRKGSLGKIDIYGLMNKASAPVFPITLSFCVYLCLTEGRGMGQGCIEVESASGSVIYRGESLQLQFGSNPLALQACIIRICACEFPAPGLYWVHFVYNEVDLQKYALLVEKS